MLSGTWSDKAGKRKAFVLAGYAASTASKPFFAAASTWAEAFLVRALDRVGKGIRTAPRDSLISDSVSEKKVGRAFGIHRTIDQIGAIVGPVTAFALLQVVDIRGIFIASLAPGAMAVIILIFFVKEVATKSNARTTMLDNISALIRGNRPLVFLLVVTGIFSLGAFNFSFVLLRASDLGIEKSFVPLVYAVINASYSAIGIPSGMLADKIGKEKTLIVGYSVFFVFALFMLLAWNALYAYVLAVIYGLYSGISETVQRAVIPRYAAHELRGTAFGLYNLVVGICLFASNITFGFLWDSFLLNVAVLYSATITIMAISGTVLFVHKYPISTRPAVV